MNTILICDDDQYINDMLNEALLKNGYSVLRAFSGTEAEMILSSKPCDLILLDLMMPGMSGEELIKKIKNIPVIVVSAKADISDKIEMLDGGAVDYVTKPFDIRELLARIRLRLKSAEKTSEILSCEGLTINTKNHTAEIDGNEIVFTKTEFAILKILLINSPDVVTKSAMLDKLFYETPDCVESSLKVHISNIRRKIRAYTEREYIENVWGIGFKIS